MIVPDPKVARTLLTRYATLRIAQAERETPQAARELQDVTYTLCVLMGTPDVREAVAAADALLESASVQDAGNAELAGHAENGLSLAV
ncbi:MULTISPECIES: DUF5133 domain-containing protein [Streptomyces]|uniref:DUF5133 domain-containing protein n=1 Tax=Streptomyces TaxID=1883 RepID=UPI00211A9459|nr:DUF5133 domain-containing protein [Streptomyces hilarionis]MCQ9135863.1 DUF5133 domain-containing protein [Streptomyces hilarionis]